MANLLVHLESFAWQDLQINRAEEMDDLILAVGAANELEDTIHGHPDAYHPHLGWGTITDLLSYSEEEYMVFTGGWFNHDHQKILHNLWRNPTRGNAKNLEELDQEPDFIDQNNGLIGCFYQPVPDKMVYDQDSLHLLHRNFVTVNQSLRKTNSKYFYQHYWPVLLEKPAKIRDLIAKKQVNTCFLRLDTPVTGPDGNPLHSGKIEMHFNDKNSSCLYIDGTWKHGGFTIPQDAKNSLESWGFILPSDQRP